LRFGAAVIALAALLGWGTGVTAAAAGAPSAGGLRGHAVATTRSGTAESITGIANDQRIARDAGLRRSDLPPGWVVKDPSSRPRGDAPCPGIRRAAVDSSGGMISPFFSASNGDVLSAQSQTYVYADTAGAQHWFAGFTSRGTRACLAHVLRNALSADGTVPGVTLSPIRLRSLPVAPVGDQDSAFRITVRVSYRIVTLKVNVDTVFVRAGRGIEIFSLGGLGSPFGPRLESSLVKTVTDRLTADLRSAP
jgi:hypothetical protein